MVTILGMKQIFAIWIGFIPLFIEWEYLVCNWNLSYSIICLADNDIIYIVKGHLKTDLEATFMRMKEDHMLKAG